MNRQQRRAAARGRTTPKKEKAPRLFANVTDAAGNTKRIELEGEEISAEEMERVQAAQAERQRQLAAAEEARMRVIAHSHGLWLPGDQL